MALKYPESLNDKGWESLMRQLNGKPDKNKINMLREAVENGKKIKEYM
jgi:hypothetical protein